MKIRKIYHTNEKQSRFGRSITALIGLMTNNRIAVYVRLTISIVYRDIKDSPTSRSALARLYQFLVLLPLTIALMLFLSQCPHPHTPDPREEEIASGVWPTLAADSAASPTHTPD